MAGQGKKNQHYVPQAHLRGFTLKNEKSLVCEYDKELGIISNPSASVRQVCVRDFYYAQEDLDGNPDVESMENAFHDVEDSVPRIIKKFNPKSEYEKFSLEDGEREALSLYIAMQFTRGPSYRDGLQDMFTRIAKLAFNNVVRQDEKNGTLPEIVKEPIEKDGTAVEAKEWASIEGMVVTGIQIHHSLMQKCWQVLVAHKDVHFITSDTPARFNHSEKLTPGGFGIGPAHPLSLFHMPLNKRLAIEIAPHILYGKTRNEQELAEDRFIFLEKGKTKDFNSNTARAALRYVYASFVSDKLCKMIAKHKGTSSRLMVG